MAAARRARHAAGTGHIGCAKGLPMSTSACIVRVSPPAACSPFSFRSLTKLVTVTTCRTTSVTISATAPAMAAGFLPHIRELSLGYSAPHIDLQRLPLRSKPSGQCP